MPLFPAMLDTSSSTFSRILYRNTHPKSDSDFTEPQTPRRRASLLSRRNSKSSTSSTSNSQPPRRHSLSSGPSSSQENHNTFRRKLTLPHLDLGNLATKYLAPTTYMSLSPTHDRNSDFEDCSRRRSSSSCGRGTSLKGGESAKSGIVRADEVHVVGERNWEKEEDGAPLCREAEIEKWREGRKVSSVEVGREATWALCW